MFCLLSTVRVRRPVTKGHMDQISREGMRTDEMRVGGFDELRVLVVMTTVGWQLVGQCHLGS